MKTYACYPGFRGRFQPGRSFYQHPSFQPVNTAPSASETRPAANILRNEGSYEIQLAVPGYTKDRIKLEVNDGQLIITGSNPSADADKPKFLRNEFSHDGFKRTFKLHRNANTDALKASFDQGILSVVIPDRTPETIKIDIH